MSVLRIIIVFATIVLLGAVSCSCMGEDEPGQKTTSSTERRGSEREKEPTTNTNTQAEKIVDQLKISATTSSNEVKPGETLRLKLSIENTGKETQELTFNSSQRFDVRVEDESGREIWRWSDGRVFAQVIETVAIQPGKSISFDAEWPGIDSAEKPVSPGDYSVFAWFTADNLRSEELEIKVSVVR